MADGWPLSGSEISLEILSPLHVGSGAGPLLLDLDFAVHQGTVWVADHGRLSELFTDEELRAGTPDVRLSKLLGPDRYPDYAAYSLPARGEVGGRILPCIKDPYCRPYIPGSSLKGAIRSALAWAAAAQPELAPRGGELGRGAKYAALPWERRVFGPTPHRDLMRALLVGDSCPASPDRLELARVTVHSLQGADLKPKGPAHSFSLPSLACSSGVRKTSKHSWSAMQHSWQR